MTFKLLQIIHLFLTSPSALSSNLTKTTHKNVYLIPFPSLKHGVKSKIKYTNLFLRCIVRICFIKWPIRMIKCEVLVSLSPMVTFLCRWQLKTSNNTQFKTFHSINAPYSLDVQGFSSLVFQPFVIIHCSTTVLTFLDWSWRLRVGPCCSCVTFSHYPHIAQITLSSAALFLLPEAFAFGFMAWDSPSTMQCILWFHKEFVISFFHAF